MPTPEIKTQINTAIQAFASGNLTENAMNLFKTLGYNTERSAHFSKPVFKEFEEQYINGKPFNKDKALIGDWIYIDQLFQLSREEISKQKSLFDTKKVENTIIETYMFFVIELNKEQYTRTELSLITREVNRLFPMPVMILFRYGSRLTFSIINRRLHKRDDGKDVLEKVTQIKDIIIASPHRAHIEILFDLSFYELNAKHPISNFVELHNAWQKTLDTKELNKKFFNELANWYIWAQGLVVFPNDKKIDEDKNSQTNLIRLITRLIFVWFLKEKNLIDENLFNSAFINKILKVFDPESEDTYNYYNAVLQNLFFGTLNQKMNEREFAKDGGSTLVNKEHFGVKTIYRYAKLFNISENEVINLFKDIPFLNGGLFDCLDKTNEDTGKVEYIDGFSRNPKKAAEVPDVLFFGKERIYDLTEGYGYKKPKEKCEGLLEIFKSYKFTIEENTPIEEEIALDPELLGKVFENLLAFYNPETGITARKQTGSFYTPREIVNYMVDESIIAYLKTKLLEETPAAFMEMGKSQTELFGNKDRKGQLKMETQIGHNRWAGKEDKLEEELRRLVSYEAVVPEFPENETQAIIKAIDNCKILDPACGSGAFPMGILHKLVLVLSKLDKDNKRWQELQKQKALKDTEQAYNIGEIEVRNEKLKEISETFDCNASDYGRKLYLIENCIYGVDIQPIAVQIAKLRFFISLVVDQKEKPDAENRGIRPLPNLETKFVAANTLIGLEKIGGLRPTKLYDLEKELSDIRHKYFDVKNRKQKLAYQNDDKKKRKEIADLLKSSGWSVDSANKISSFDLYDQNASADWFEPEWMFGKELEIGFDIVIGNPPYIFTRDAEFSDEFKNQIASKYFSVLSTGDKKSKANQSGKINLFALFILRGLFESKKKGVLSFIVPNNLLRTTTYDLIRKYLLENSIIEELVDLGSDVFDNVTASTIIFRLRNEKNNSNHKTKIITAIKNIESGEFDKSKIEQNQFKKNVSYTFNIFGDLATNILLTKISTGNEYLGKFCIDIIEGIVAHKHLISETEGPNSQPLLEGKTIKKFALNRVNKFIIWDIEKIHRTRPDYLWKAPKKIIIQRISGGHNPLTATIDTRLYKTFASINNLLLKPEFKDDYEYILALINSRVLNWFYANNFSNNSKLTVNISKTFLEKLPVPKITKETQHSVTTAVNKILSAKEKNPKADTNALEKELDTIVYELYDLTEEEIKIVERRE